MSLGSNGVMEWSGWNGMKGVDSSWAARLLSKLFIYKSGEERDWHVVDCIVARGARGTLDAPDRRHARSLG